MRRRSLTSTALSGLAALGSTMAVLALFAHGCDGGPKTPPRPGGGDAGGNTKVLHPDAPPLPGESECTVTVTTEIAVPGAVHVETCSPVQYATNPPSGGDHWGFWAAYAKYTSAV